MNAFVKNKIMYHPDRIHEWMHYGSTRPIVMEFDLTNACDNFCPWCFGYKGLDRQDKKTWNVDNFGAKFSKEEAFDVIEQMDDFGVLAVTLTGGGEPLVSKHCMDVIEYVKRNNMECSLITNGNRLTEEKANIILDNCTWVRISVDATDEEEYLQEHGVKNWDKLVENILTLVMVKEKNNYNCTIGIGYLTNGDNDDKILKFARMGLELGVDYSQFRPMLIGWASTGPFYKSKDTIYLIWEAQAKYNNENYFVVSSEHKYNMIEKGTIKRNYSLCHGESFSSVIAADKKMYVCCHMRGNKKYAIGDLSENTIKEIWESDQRKSALSNVDVDSFECPPLCRHDGTNRTLHELTVIPSHKNFI